MPKQDRVCRSRGWPRITADAVARGRGSFSPIIRYNSSDLVFRTVRQASLRNRILQAASWSHLIGRNHCNPDLHYSKLGFRCARRK